MLVGGGPGVGSVGGGQLEWLASGAARGLLDSAGPPRLVRLALGPSLGQCCGGIVWLVLERIPPDSAADWRLRADAVARGQGLRRQLAVDDAASRWSVVREALGTPSAYDSKRQARARDNLDICRREGLRVEATADGARLRVTGKGVDLQAQHLGNFALQEMIDFKRNSK